MSTPINFVLSELESSVQMSVNGGMDAQSITALDVSAVAIFEVSLDDMKSVFKFQTDAVDLTDLSATDIKYYVDADAFPEVNSANAMMDATDSSGAIASSYANNKMLVAHDFVRYLASKLFNTYHGVDLFNNEVDLLKNLRSICGSDVAGNTWFDIKSKLEKVGLSGTHANILGADGAKYMTIADTTQENLCRVLFEQMVNNASPRFADISLGSDAPQSLPFSVNDSISFKLNIAPAAGQEELTGVSAIDTRSYEVRLLIVDTPANTVVAADEA